MVGINGFIEHHLPDYDLQQLDVYINMSTNDEPADAGRLDAPYQRRGRSHISRLRGGGTGRDQLVFARAATFQVVAASCCTR